MSLLRRFVSAGAEALSPATRFCTRCGQSLGTLDKITIANNQARCRSCAQGVKEHLHRWRDQFRAACSDGLLSSQEWHTLVQQLTTSSITTDEAVAFIRTDAVAFAERTLAFAKADGEIDATEEQHLRWLIRELQLSESAPHILSEVDYLAKLRRIQEGTIPTVPTNIAMVVDEICYFDGPATYHKVHKAGAIPVPGRLVVTNRRIIFSAVTAGGEVPLSKVLGARRHFGGIFLELSRAANSGFYGVEDPLLLSTVITAAVRLANRQVLAAGERDSRRLPQHVKAAVWQRDAGRCVQCGAMEYLEFDHVIPHSKGGATSVNNLQLLCRRCNLQKRDNI